MASEVVTRSPATQYNPKVASLQQEQKGPVQNSPLRQPLNLGKVTNSPPREQFRMESISGLIEQKESI